MSYTTTLAMTAVFTPPPDCSSRWTYEPETWNSVPGGIIVQNDIYASQDTSCYPSGFDQWGRAQSFIQVFSPGACPSGYDAISTGYSNDVTTSVCCPAHFSFTQTLSSVNAGSKSAAYYGCTSMYPSGATTTVFAATLGFTSASDGTTTQFTTIATPVLMWAQPITVAYQQKDLALFTTISSTTASTFASSASTATSPSIISQQTTTTTSQTSSSSSNLTGGDIAGIAIGAAAVLGILLGLAIFFRRRKTDKPAEQQITTEIPPQAVWAHAPQGTWQPASYDMGGNGGNGGNGGEVQPYYPTQEQKVEAPVSSRPAYGELDSHPDRRYELSGERS